MTEITRERNAGIDLFRLLSMFMVVGLHVLGQGGILYSVPSLTLKGEIVWFFEIAMYCAVDCFALISGFLGVNSKRKTTRLVNMTFQIFFYCSIFSIGYIAYSIINNNPLELRFLVKSFFPTLLGGYWYVSAYFCLCLFAPLLDKLLDLPRAQLKKAMIAVVVVFCCFSRLQGRVSGLGNGYTFLWIAVLYLLGGYMAKYEPFKKWSIKFNLLGYLACVLLTLLSKILIEIVTVKVLGRPVKTDLLVAYTSPTILLCSIFLFNIFYKVKPCNRIKKVVTFFAPAAFGVYIIHCQPVVFEKLMKGSLAFFGSYPVYFLIPLAFAIAVGIFIFCLVIDLLRIKLFKLCRVNKCSEKIANLIDKMISKLAGEDREQIKSEEPN